MKRRFRAGQTHGARLKTRQPLIQALAAATAKAAACGVAAFLFAFWAERRNRFLARGALHVGVVAKLVGMREITLY
jgi:succinoglycan biosynthesis protein ExoM